MSWSSRHRGAVDSGLRCSRCGSSSHGDVPLAQLLQRISSSQTGLSARTRVNAARIDYHYPLPMDQQGGLNMNNNVCARSIVCALGVLVATAAFADNPLGGDEGKLALTAGFTDLDGAGGGGLVPLAFITGYGSRDSWGANAHFTDIPLRDFTLRAMGVSVGLFDRIELSYTRHDLDVTNTALDGLGVKQQIFGAKVKLMGESVYGQDSWLPQVAVGIEYKKNDGIKDAAHVGLPGLVNPQQLGAQSEHGEDYYLNATKVWLAESLVVNAVVRYTKANQFGLLGFGGDRHSGYSLRPEATVAYLFTRRFALGTELRTRPHNLSVDDESSAWDVFGAWAPTKNISLVLAYVNVGSILAPVTGVSRREDGPYLSIQAGF